MVSEVSSGIQDYMREKQLNLQLIASHESHETVLNALGHAPQLGFDGVLVLNYHQERYDSTIDRLLDLAVAPEAVPGAVPVFAVPGPDAVSGLRVLL